MPSFLPIQFLCCSLVASGQSTFSKSFNNSSLYLVILKNHCSRFFCNTSDSQRSHTCKSSPFIVFLITCSLANTVWHEGHQFAGAFFLYANPFLKSSKN